MQIGGFQKTSLIDYPGKICAIVFTIGCNFRCPFCHNSELVLKKKIRKLHIFDENKILKFLEKRKNLLDAVEITGGEPTLQQDLEAFMKKLRKIGYLIKLDTNGSNPQKIKDLVEGGLVDYIAMDIKNSLEPAKYSKTIGVEMKSMNNIKKSIETIINSGMKYEFRTTVVPGLHTKEDIKNICLSIKNAKKYVIQNFSPSNPIDPRYKKIKGFSSSQMSEFLKTAKKIIPNSEIR